MLIESSPPFELPECSHLTKPLLITPAKPTPNHTLDLSNLDNQPFFRFPVEYIFLFEKSTSVDALKSSLALALVHYYPLAGRLRDCSSNNGKLEVDCNGKGAVFVEAFMDLTVDEAYEIFNKKPDMSWRKLLHKVDEATNFIDIPPLVVQVTYLRSGGMILSTAICHCICDGFGTSQFLNDWACLAANQDAELPIQPFHSRCVLKSRDLPRVEFDHLAYYKSTSESECGFNLFFWLLSRPDLVPTSIIFSAEDILRLKSKCSSDSIKCTSFEALLSHTWRSWVHSLDLPMDFNIKILFAINVREKLSDDIPKGYYGNAFVLGSTETTVQEIVNSNLHEVVALVQAAKKEVTGEYVKSYIDLLDDEGVTTDLRGSFVFSEWSKLGLTELDFGGGKCMHFGTMHSIVCLFLPVIGQKGSVRVLLSLPKASAEKYEGLMKGFLDEEEDCNA